jgi:hypothetical protein
MVRKYSNLLDIIPVEPRRAMTPDRKKVNALIEPPACARVCKGSILGWAIILWTIIITKYQLE